MLDTHRWGRGRGSCNVLEDEDEEGDKEDRRELDERVAGGDVDMNRVDKKSA